MASCKTSPFGIGFFAQHRSGCRILERGTLADWRRLAAAIQRDPEGPYARAVKRVISGSHFYGTTTLWGDFRARCHAEAMADRPRED